MDLFELAETQGAKRFLNIIVNGKEIKKASFLDLFPPEKFDELYLISYVSSYKFFFENTKPFKKVVLVLGEEESASKFLSFNFREIEDILKEIKDVEIANKIINGSIKFRYISEDYRLHSKIYFAKGKDGNRVAVGSANFTSSAFESNQFEELLVFDEEPYISIYEKRVQALIEKSKELFTKRVIDKIKESLIEADSVYSNKIEKSKIEAGSIKAEKIEKSIISADNLQAKQISNSILLNTGVILSDKDKQEIAIEKCINATETIAKPELLVEKLEKEKDEIYKIEEEIKTTNELIEKITKSKNKRLIFKPKSEIKKISEAIKVSVVRTSQKSEEYIKRRRVFIFKNYDIFEQEGDNLVLLLSNMPNKEKLSDQIRRLRAFIKSYALFTVNKDPNNEKRVTESILFSLMSVFIWLMRNKTADLYGKEKLAEIPLMLIIGGQANTGKSKLLFFINKLLGNNYDVYNYQEIDVRGQRIIADMLETENIFPLLVDEVEQKLFDSSTGQMLIKSATNKLVNPHPCFIGTTNKEFSPRAEIVRRLYYINFTDPFLMGYSEEKKKADKYLSEEVGDIDDTIFKYFVAEMLEIIRKDSENFFMISDPLFYGRKILKKMFEDNELDSSCVSDEFLGDFYRTSSIEWKNIFIYHRELFKLSKDEDEELYLVDLNSIAQDVGYKRRAEALRNKLPPDVLKSSQEPVIALRKDKFLDFIGIKDPKDKGFKKIFSFFGLNK